MFSFPLLRKNDDQAAAFLHRFRSSPLFPFRCKPTEPLQAAPISSEPTSHTQRVRGGPASVTTLPIMEMSLQDRFAPDTICFGCGPANPSGLHIKSFVDGNELVCDWTPKPEHAAYPGILNGGIIATILDCHSDWAAMWHLRRARQSDELPLAVTADFQVTFHQPTPLDLPVHLRAHVVEADDPKVTVEATLSSGGTVRVTSRGLFVAVAASQVAAARGHHRLRLS